MREREEPEAITLPLVKFIEILLDDRELLCLKLDYAHGNTTDEEYKKRIREHYGIKTHRPPRAARRDGEK